MFPLLRLVSLRYLRSKKARVLLSLWGIILGVAMIMAVAVLNESILFSYRQLLGDLSGETQIEVTGMAAGNLEEAALEQAQKTTGVKLAVPVIRNTTFLKGNQDGKEFDIMAYGVDARLDSGVRQYLVEKGQKLSPDNQDAILISGILAKDAGIVPGDDVQLLTGSGFQTFTIAGILAGESTLGQANQGRVAFMNLVPAQKAFNKEGRLDMIHVVLEEKAETTVVEKEFKETLGDSVSLEAPAGRGQEIDDMLQGLKIMLGFSGAISMLAGLFMIFNTISMGVKERRRELSILRSLGSRRKDLFRLIMGEALVLGLTGTTLGILAGTALAGTMATTINSTLLTIFRLNASQIYIGTGRAVLVFATGVLTTLAAAYLPAREALAVSPVEAFRPSEASNRHTSPWTMTCGIMGILAGLILIIWVLQNGSLGDLYGYYLAIIMFGAFIVFFGTVMLLPWLITTKAMAPVRWLWQAFLRLPGRLAVDNLGREPKRSAATIAAVVLAITMVVGMGTLSYSFKSYVSGWVDRVIGWDLLVTPTDFSSLGSDVPMPPGFSDELESVPGVELASPERYVFNEYGNSKVLLVILNMKEYPSFANMATVEGLGPEATVAAMERGEGVAVTANFKARYHLGAGDTLEINSPKGKKLFPILAVANDYAPDTGIVYLDEALFLKDWDDRGVDAFAVNILPGASVEKVKQDIEEHWQGKRHIFVKSNAEFKEQLLKTVNDSFALNNALILIALLIGTLGIINTLLISIIERRREMGLLRSLGATRSQVRRMVWGEAVAMGLIAAILGNLLGIGMAWALISWQNNLNGMLSKFELVPSVLASSVIAAGIIAPLAAWLPARRAVKLEITEAVRYE